MARDLNGSSDHINIADYSALDITGAFTLFVWANHDDFTNDFQPLLYKSICAAASTHASKGPYYISREVSGDSLWAMAADGTNHIFVDGSVDATADTW